MIAKKTTFKKRSWENKFLIGLLAIFNILIIAFLFISNLKVYSQAQEIKSQYINLNQEIRDLDRKNQELKEMFSFFSEEGYSETYLREKGMYQKEGEHVVVIHRDEFSGPKTVSQDASQKGTASLLDKIKNFFESIFK
jgi:cell division protein FtsB